MVNRRYKRWTEEEDAVILEGVAAGLSYADITAKLPDRTESTVRRRRSHLNYELTNPKPKKPRSYHYWTEEEDAIIEEALGRGLKQSAIMPLLDGRNLNQTQNRIRILRGRQRRTCYQCGGPLADSDKSNCEPCREERKAAGIKRYNKLRAEGICVTCGVEPADASLTKCERCIERHRSYRSKPNPHRSRNHTQGLLRWIGSPGVGRHTKGFHADAQVVDLFGGSAAYSLRAHQEGHRLLAYNDIHTGLHAFMAALKDGKAREVWNLCRDLARRPVDELVDIYKRGPSLHREGYAAVTYTLARSSTDKNLRRPKVVEVYEPAKWNNFRSRAKRARLVFEDAEVTNLDFVDALKRFDGPDTLFFCDPPYPGTAKFELTMTGRHGELVERLMAIKGRFYLVFHSSRRAAETLRDMPHVYRTTILRGPIRVHEIMATNYPIRDAEPMDWASFGL